VSRRGRGLLQLGLAAGVGLAVPAGAPADPHVDYMLHCRGCHLEDGSGAPGIVPDFRNTVARFLTVPGGRRYLIRVPGSAQSALPDDRLAEVLNFIVRRYGPREIAESEPPFTAGEVAASRRPPLSEVGPIREALLRALAEPTAAPGAEAAEATTSPSPPRTSAAPPGGTPGAVLPPGPRRPTRP